MTTFNIPLSVNADDVRDALVEFMKALGLDNESHWAVNKPITIHPIDEGFTISAGLVLTDDDGEIIEHNGDPVSIPVNYIAEEDDADKWEDCPDCGDDDEDSALCACDEDDDVIGFTDLTEALIGIDALMMKHARITEAPDVLADGSITLDVAVDAKSMMAEIKQQIEDREKTDQAAYVLRSWIREVEARHFPGDILLISETDNSARDIMKALAAVGGDSVTRPTIFSTMEPRMTFEVAGRTVHVETFGGYAPGEFEQNVIRGRSISTVLIDGRTNLPEWLIHQIAYRTPATYTVNF